MSLAPARTKSVCCATLYDAAFARVGAFCRRSLVHYARRHGYDVAHSPGGSIDRPLSWHKLPLIESLFAAGYEFVLWVDADAMIVNSDRDIASETTTGKHLYLVQHEVHGRVIPNMGVFLLRNSDWSRDLLRTLWGLDRYVHHPWWENAALIHLLTRDEFAYRGICNPEGPQLGDQHIAWLPERWNHLWRHSQDGPPIIRHFASSPMHKRLSRMRRCANPWQHFRARKWQAAQLLDGASMPVAILAAPHKRTAA